MTHYVVTYEPNFNPYFPIGIIGTFDNKEDEESFIESIKWEAIRSDEFLITEVTNDKQKAIKEIESTEGY